MYIIEYLPIAQRDIIEITSYISEKLTNVEAALNVSTKIINAIDKLEEFPYIYSILRTSKPLINEYRKLIVDNYIVLYYVNESNKVVTISRIIYSKRNYIT